ncbi:hypothetical protein FB451DRAFT_1174923 [Mycena latifolia]|nr:hypothetical protein FB451DRAFT_1174923 [Mycena latifolia]
MRRHFSEHTDKSGVGSSSPDGHECLPMRQWPFPELLQFAIDFSSANDTFTPIGFLLIMISLELVASEGHYDATQLQLNINLVLQPFNSCMKSFKLLAVKDHSLFSLAATGLPVLPMAPTVQRMMPGFTPRLGHHERSFNTQSYQYELSPTKDNTWIMGLASPTPTNLTVTHLYPRFPTAMAHLRESIRTAAYGQRFYINLLVVHLQPSVKASSPSPN